MPEANDEANRTQTNGCVDLRGKTAVVTGSSSGIGREIANHFAAAGAAIVVHGATRRKAAEQLCNELIEMHAPATVLMADFADPRAIDRFVEQAWDWRGGVDIWVNNAGVDVLTGDTSTLDFEQKLELLWRIDVRATIQLSRLVGERMLKATRAVGERSILNIGWDQADVGMAGDSGEMFAATKGAIMAFSRSLAKSLAPTVRVNCLAPGWIKTAWGSTASETWQSRARGESLLDRWGTPKDIARVATFLVSANAGFVNGQVVAVNGGFRGSATEIVPNL